MRTNDCDSRTRAGRLAKATQFADVARDVHLLADGASDVADAFVTLAVHAGIAAADVICCARLGRYSRSGNHHEAVTLLAKADKDATRHLQALLEMKDRAGYSSMPVTSRDTVRAARAMDLLITLARSVT